MKSNTSHKTLVKITGEDSSLFLQGQFSNDVNLLTTQWQKNTYCNPKGRVIDSFILWRHQQTFYALLSTSIIKPTLQRLQQYILRAKVSIEVVDNISAVFLTQEQVQQIQCIAACRSLPSYTVHIVSDTPLECVLKLKAGYLHLSSKVLMDGASLSRWQQHDIQNSIVHIDEQSTELYLPQMLNLEEAINFKKGCYTGQEIIARTHYLGKIKQQLYLVKTLKGKSIIGQVLYIDDTFATKAGVIVNSYADYALVIMRTEHIQNILYDSDASAIEIVSSIKGT